MLQSELLFSSGTAELGEQGREQLRETAEQAKDESAGLIDAVTDEEILEAYQWIAGKDGVFAEPASAASVAGVLKLHRSGHFKDKKGTITCTLTGHGLKDPDIAIKSVRKPTVLPADLNVILKEIGFK